MSCLMKGCKNTKHFCKNKNLRFFNLPKIDFIRKRWIKACDVEEQDLPKAPLVCSVHFLESDMFRTNKIVRLKRNVCPMSLSVNNTMNYSVLEETYTDVGISSKIKTTNSVPIKMVIENNKNMICRLCLEELNELNDDFFPICEEKGNSTETEIAKIIKKYLHIETSDKDNVVSNKICTSCWHHLNDFHQFWLLIEQKQKRLQWQHAAATVVDIKSEEVLVEEQSTEMYTSLEDKSKGIKNILCEPQIQLCAVPEPFLETSQEEFAAAALTSASSSNSDDDDFVPRRKLIFRKIKQKCTKSTVISREEERYDTVSASTAESVALTDKIEASSVRREIDAYLAEKTALLKCCICAEDQFTNFNALLNHFRSEHNRPGYMLCCNKRFPKRSLYANHLKWHDNPDIFKCLKCNKHMSGQKSFQSHMAFMHPPEGDEFFQCEFCPRKFTKQYILSNHIKSHCQRGTDHKLLCDLCSMSFRLRGELKDHLKRVHSHEVGHICDICGKNLKTKNTLLAHIQAVHHVGEQLPPVQCKVCEKWFRNEHSLEGHMYKHRDEQSGRKYVCNICGAVKLTRQSLHSHKKYHHSAIVYKCNMCDKTFKRDLNLKEHVATHTGEALYHCEVCGQTFRSHRNKYAHMKKVHPAVLLQKTDRLVSNKPPNTIPQC